MKPNSVGQMNNSNTSSSTSSSSNGFNYMLMNPDEYTLDDFDGASD